MIAAAVLLANVLYLAGVFHPDPVYQLTGLGSAPPSSLLPGLDTIDPNSGFTAEALGHLAASDWLHGHVPWWNPYEGLGAPLAGEMQSAALFPLVLLYALGGGQVLLHVILELVAGFSAFFLLRRLVRSPVAATAGAVAFALNGTFSWLGNAAVNPVAFLPLLLLGVEQCLDPERRGLAGWPLIGLAVALSLYAGFPEMAFIDGLFALMWFAVRASRLGATDVVVFAKRAAAGVGSGLLLAAPILVAFLSYLPHADLGRHAAGYGGSSQPAGLELPALVMPYLFGPIFAGFAAHPSGALSRFWAYSGGYLGAGVLFLAALAVPGRRERRLRVSLAVWVALGVARSVGVPGVQQAVDAVPGVGNTIFYRYAWPSWSLALAVLAAMSIDCAARRARLVPAVTLAVAALLVLGALAVPAASDLRRLPAVAHLGAWSGLSAAAAVAVLGAVVIGTARGSPVLLAAAVVAEAVGLFVVPQMSAPRHVALDHGPVRYLQAHLGTGRFYTLGPIAPDYGSYWGIASLAVSDNPIPRSFARFVTSRLDANVSPLTFTGTARLDPAGPGPLQEFVSHLDGYRAAGVRYLVSYSFTKVPARLDLPVVYRDPQVTIRAVPGAAPLYSVTGACRLTATVPPTADCRGAGALIRREQQMPGWTATDDGRPVTVSAYHRVFQTLPLHPGLNRLEFGFTPPHMRLGIAAGAAGVAVIGVAALRGPSRRRRRRKSPKDVPAGGASFDPMTAAPATLTVVMPVYNEAATFARVMSQVTAKEIPGVEIDVVVVESASTDGTREAVREWAGHPRVTVIFEDAPRGKGHAVRRGLAAAGGEFILIQDADLEYDVADYDRLVEPLLAGRVAFVLGRRSAPGGDRRLRRADPGFRAAHLLNAGHAAFVALFNVVYGQRLHDPFTMFKVFRRDCVEGLHLECDRFDFDWELTAKLIRSGHRPVEIPVSYRSRSFAEGKKVRLLRDPPTWVRACFKYRFARLHAYGLEP